MHTKTPNSKSFNQINPKSTYSESDIELKEYHIREKLLSSGHIDKRFKRDLIEFLELAKNWLIFVKCRKGGLAAPTTIPDNYKFKKPTKEDLKSIIDKIK